MREVIRWVKSTVASPIEVLIDGGVISLALSKVADSPARIRIRVLVPGKPADIVAMPGDPVSVIAVTEKSFLL